MRAAAVIAVLLAFPAFAAERCLTFTSPFLVRLPEVDGAASYDVVDGDGLVVARSGSPLLEVRCPSMQWEATPRALDARGQVIALYHSRAIECTAPCGHDLDCSGGMPDLHDFALWREAFQAGCVSAAAR